MFWFDLLTDFELANFIYSLDCEAGTFETA